MVSVDAKYGQVDGYVGVFVVDHRFLVLSKGGGGGAEVAGLVGYDLEGDGVRSEGVAAEDG